MRINKFLSSMGICSRREADRLCTEGRVSINGEPAAPGSDVSDSDTVSVDGREVDTAKRAEPVILAFNKPMGVVCSASSDGDPIVTDFIDYEARVYPIGRLDRDSRGLILLTNRGELVNSLNKSAGAHEKEYAVRCSGAVTDDFLRRISRGVEISVPQRKSPSGERKYRKVTTRRCRVKRIDEFAFGIILTEGLNREIRRMCEALGNKVTDLQRVRIMNVRLGHLREGTYRKLKGDELREFENLLGI